MLLETFRVGDAVPAHDPLVLTTIGSPAEFAAIQFGRNLPNCEMADRMQEPL
jgi:hypothetical protein